MRQETIKEGREVLPPRHCPQDILREGGIRRQPHRTRGHRNYKDPRPLTTAFSTVRSKKDHASATMGTKQPITDSNARSHDYRLFKSMLNALVDLAQSRHLGIIRNRKHLVESLPEAVSRHRAHSDATSSHTQAAIQQGAATHSHRTRSTRVPESTAITCHVGATG